MIYGEQEKRDEEEDEQEEEKNIKEEMMEEPICSVFFHRFLLLSLSCNPRYK